MPTDKEIEKEAFELYPNTHYVITQGERLKQREAHIAARKQSLSELAEAKEEIEALKSDCNEYSATNKRLLEDTHKLIAEIEQLKASILKEVEDAMAFSEKWIDLDEQDKWSYDNRKEYYLNQVKERLNIQS